MGTLGVREADPGAFFGAGFFLAAGVDFLLDWSTISMASSACGMVSEAGGHAEVGHKA